MIMSFVTAVTRAAHALTTMGRTLLQVRITVGSPLRIRSTRDVWLYTICICLLASVLSELAVLLLFLSQGAEAFHLRNAIIFAGIVPILIALPITLGILRMSLALAHTQAELRRLAETDPLTHLPNRRSFFDMAETVLQDAAERKSPVTLLVIDADHFKELNDSYGHAVGDQALVSIADALRENFRQSDMVCRVGGEEFAVLLPGFDAARARPLAQRLVDAVLEGPIQTDTTIIEFTVSCGVADTSITYDLAGLFKAADDAMYAAKQQGRSRVALGALAA